jgi:tetratricopeptide (TPR) repeat protein
MLQMAVATAPDRSDLKRQLARVLLQAERFQELEELALPMLDDPAGDPEVLHCLALGAIANERHEVAQRALERAIALGHAPSSGALANLLYRLGRHQEALEAGLRALERDPGDFYAAGPVARVLLARGERMRLWSLCQEIRSRGGWGAFIPSAMALAAQTDEQHREVERLVGREVWFDERALGLERQLNERLAKALLGLMGATLPQRKASTGSGRRIDQLQRATHTDEVLAQLFEALRSAVLSYGAERESALAASEWCPMGPRRPSALRFDSWAIAVNRDGHESWHMHPSGWLSGVYYVRVPETSASREPHAGEIEFGPYPFAADAAAGWPRWRIRPGAGQLLLFPSSYGHRTWPTGVDEQRIIVAFDVLAGDPDPSAAG